MPAANFGPYHEVVVAFAFATRGRLKALLGGLAAQDITGADGLR